MVQGEKEDTYRYERRQYHDHPCAVAHQGKARVQEERLCDVCKKPMVQGPNENNSKFMARTCCTLKCAARKGGLTRKGIMPKPSRELQQKVYRMTTGKPSVPITTIETVEEFLARGGKVTRIPTPPDVPFGGVPVRSSGTAKKLY